MAQWESCIKAYQTLQWGLVVSDEEIHTPTADTERTVKLQWGLVVSDEEIFKLPFETAPEN